MFGEIIFLIVGLIFVVLVYLLGIRKKVTLLHSYHYKNIIEEDKKIL